MLRAPVRRLTCQHSFCYCCLERTALCGRGNEYQVLVMPQTAGIRALVLTGSSPALTIEFLAALRKKLYGHLEDYFDIVVASAAGMLDIATLPWKNADV